MSNNYRATPRFQYEGLKDDSPRAELGTPEARPQHLPHWFLWGQRGKLIPQIMSGGDASKAFGTKTFDLRSKFATHQTVFANKALQNANISMLQRLVPDDAKKAGLRLSLLVEEKTNQFPYARDEDGKVIRDVNGQLTFDEESENTVDVMELTWLVQPIGDGGEGPPLFGEAVTQDGPVPTSTVVPVMDLLGEFGSAANLYGLSFLAPTLSSSIAINDDNVVLNNAYVYRLIAKRKPEENVSANIVSTIAGETFIDFTLKKDTVDTSGINELFLETAYFKNYENKNVSPRQYADLDAIHIYSTEIEALLGGLEDAERAALVDSGFLADETETLDIIPQDGKHTINIFSGVSYNDFKYESIRIVESVDEDVDGAYLSAQMRGTATHYLQGGDDGDLSADNFEEAVQKVMAAYDAYVIPYLPGATEPHPNDIIVDFTDIARWPQSAYWDSGFGEDTKIALGNVLVRPNVYVVWVTHGLNDETQLLNHEETAGGETLVSAARMHPESELYGTGCCRALVHLQSGKLLQGAWKKITPVSLDLLDVVSKYMGAGDGNWKTEFRFDIGEGKVVSMFDVDTIKHDKNLPARAQDWQRSTVYVQSYDRNRLMRPGVQTVYGNPTSVLNSFLTVAASCEITTLCHQTWAYFTGVQTIQGQELLDEVDKHITELLSGNKFDGVVTVEVSSTYTARDENNGYSWTTNVILRGPNMKTVGNFNVTSDRMEEPTNA